MEPWDGEQKNHHFVNHPMSEDIPQCTYAMSCVEPCVPKSKGKGYGKLCSKHASMKRRVMANARKREREEHPETKDPEPMDTEPQAAMTQSTTTTTTAIKTRERTQESRRTEISEQVREDGTRIITERIVTETERETLKVEHEVKERYELMIPHLERYFLGNHRIRKRAQLAQALLKCPNDAGLHLQVALEHGMGEAYKDVFMKQEVEKQEAEQHFGGILQRHKDRMNQALEEQVTPESTPYPGVTRDLLEQMSNPERESFGCPFPDVESRQVLLNAQAQYDDHHSGAYRMRYVRYFLGRVISDMICLDRLPADVEISPGEPMLCQIQDQGTVVVNKDFNVQHLYVPRMHEVKTGEELVQRISRTDFKLMVPCFVSWSTEGTPFYEKCTFNEEIDEDEYETMDVPISALQTSCDEVLIPADVLQYHVERTQHQSLERLTHYFRNRNATLFQGLYPPGFLVAKQINTQLQHVLPLLPQNIQHCGETQLTQVHDHLTRTCALVDPYVNEHSRPFVDLTVYDTIHSTLKAMAPRILKLQRKRESSCNMNTIAEQIQSVKEAMERERLKQLEED